MANNIDNREAYIIIGVDEENNFEFIDISNDPDRKIRKWLLTLLEVKSLHHPVHLFSRNYSIKERHQYRCNRNF